MPKGQRNKQQRKQWDRMATLTKKQQSEQQEARETLRQMFGERDRKTVYTILRHVSSSGMSRDISLKMLDGDGTLRDITYLACIAMGDKPKDKNGNRVVRVGGCGMDMGFHVVYNLSYSLYRDVGLDRPGYVLHHEWA
jgi:hypothetical protein